jgi:hypothetical protein
MGCTLFPTAAPSQGHDTPAAAHHLQLHRCAAACVVCLWWLCQVPVRCQLPFVNKDSTTDGCAPDALMSPLVCVEELWEAGMRDGSEDGGASHVEMHPVARTACGCVVGLLTVCMMGCGRRLGRRCSLGLGTVVRRMCCSVVCMRDKSFECRPPRASVALYHYCIRYPPL